MTADVLFAGSLAAQMRAAAVAVLSALTGDQRAQAALPFADDGARRWLEYRPEPRPGACLAGLSIPARKAAHRLLATGAERPRVRAGADHHGAGGGAGLARAGPARPAQRRLLGGGLRRPRVRRALVVAVRGPPRVGDDDHGRRRGLARPGVPGRQPGVGDLRRPAGVPAAGPGGGPGPRAAGRARPGRPGGGRGVRPSRRSTSAPRPGPGPRPSSPPGSPRAGWARRPARRWASWSRCTWTGCRPRWPPGRRPGPPPGS